MKLTNVVCTTAVVAMLSFTLSSHAQEVIVEFEGQIANRYGVAPLIEQVDRARAIFVYDTSVPPYLDNGTNKNYNSITEARYEFFDAQGTPLSLGVPDFVPSTGAQIQNRQAEHGIVVGAESHTSYLIYSEDSGQYQAYVSISPFYNGYTQLYTDTTNYPRFAELMGLSNAGSAYFHMVYPGSHIDFDVVIDTITPVLPDTDGDGLSDLVDSCTTSLLDETVIFKGWYDSGVTNYVGADGCSVMDHYAACEVEQLEAPVRGIRSVRSGPSNCEKAVSYDLVADGVISYAEARMLRNALYSSYQNNEF